MKAERPAEDDRLAVKEEPAELQEPTVYRGGGASAQGADARYGLSYGAEGEDRFGDRRSAGCLDLAALHASVFALRKSSSMKTLHPKSAQLCSVGPP